MFVCNVLGERKSRRPDDRGLCPAMLGRAALVVDPALLISRKPADPGRLVTPNRQGEKDHP